MYRQNPEVKHFLPMVQFLITNNLTNKYDLLMEMEDLVETFERRDRIEFMVKYAIYLWWLKNKNEEIKKQYEQKLSKIIPLYETGPHNLFPRWEQIKDLFKHYVDQGKIRGFNTLANTTWANKSASQLWRELEQIQTEIQNEIEKNDKVKILARADQGVTMIKFENGWRWTYLDNYKDQEEAALAGHCGTSDFDKEGRLISLRDTQNMPHITADVLPLVSNKEQSLFILGQIKGKKEPGGKSNPPPNYKLYKDYLEAFYKDPRIVWVTNGSLMDFDFKEKFPEIQNDKPGMFELKKNHAKIKQLILQAITGSAFLRYKDILDKVFPNIVVGVWEINRFYHLEKNEFLKMDIEELKEWITDVVMKNIQSDFLDLLEEDFDMIFENFHACINSTNNIDTLLNIAHKINEAAKRNKQGFLSELKYIYGEEKMKNLYINDKYIYLIAEQSDDIDILEFSCDSLRYKLNVVLERTQSFDARKLWKIIEKIVFDYLDSVFDDN